MSKIFGIHFAMHDDTGCLRQWVPGDEVPVWAESRVGDHCLMLPPSDDPVVDADDDQPDIEPPAEPEAVAEDPAEPSEDVAPLDFTAPAKPARGRPRKP